MKMTFALAVLATVAFGFIGWWTFVIIAFAFGYFTRVFWIGAFAPALGWMVTAFVRDMIDHGRLSWRLAQLLHVKFGVVTYVVLFVIVALPSAFASKAGVTLRSLLANKRVG